MDEGELLRLRSNVGIAESYIGKSEGERRRQVAKDNLKRLLYRNETTVSFKKYVTKMKLKIVC